MHHDLKDLSKSGASKFLSSLGHMIKKFIYVQATYTFFANFSEV
jgi:hypothetical protein